MTQSNMIAGALVIGFLIFITTKGELSDYIGLFTLKKVQTNGTASNSHNITSDLVNKGVDYGIDEAVKYITASGGDPSVMADRSQNEPVSV